MTDLWFCGEFKPSVLPVLFSYILYTFTETCRMCKQKVAAKVSHYGYLQDEQRFLVTLVEFLLDHRGILRLKIKTHLASAREGLKLQVAHAEMERVVLLCRPVMVLERHAPRVHGVANSQQKIVMFSSRRIPGSSRCPQNQALIEISGANSDLEPCLWTLG